MLFMCRVYVEITSTSVGLDTYHVLFEIGQHSLPKGGGMICPLRLYNTAPTKAAVGQSPYPWHF